MNSGSGIFRIDELLLGEVTTSFVASYLTLYRSSYYALGYAANDLVLIAL